VWSRAATLALNAVPEEATMKRIISCAPWLLLLLVSPAPARDLTDRWGVGAKSLCRS
jgi:hypothetical protein